MSFRKKGTSGPLTWSEFRHICSYKWLFVFCRHAVKKNSEALLAANKENGIGVNAEDAQQNYRIKIGNKSFERVEKLNIFEQT
jgi:hypothetical protein